MDIENLISGDYQKAQPCVADFVQKYSQKFNLSSISSHWVEIWKAVFKYLAQPDASALHHDCVSTLRILGRDKTYLDQVIDEAQVDCLLSLADIGAKVGETAAATPDNTSEPLIIEALKCLCNLVFNSTQCQEMFSKNNAAEGIIRRIRTYKDDDVKYEIQFFDMKLLFLVTALNTEVRAKVRDDLHGLTYLTEVIDLTIHDQSRDTSSWLDDREIDLLCEILKVLFNLQMPSLGEVCHEEHQEIQFRRLTSVLRDVFLKGNSRSREKQHELHSNLINLMSSMPTPCLLEFAPSSHIGIVDGAHHDFEGRDVAVLDSLLAYLKVSLEVSPQSMSVIERLGPVLTALIKCCRCHRVMRRYIRSVILPPLRNVMRRPEEGSELRNYLCRLLTSPDLQARDLVAELLFIICKESVARMAKHTGYGNAVGVFANKGLLAAGASDAGQNRNQLYSSDSEDSDTEEYKRLQHGINPVVGCYEPPRPDPFEGMSEEQKEYEAMKLVNLIDQLDRHGIVKPARIGENGKPEPVAHLLQLQEDLTGEKK